MAHNLASLEEWAATLLQKLQPAQRRELARQVAQRLRQANQQTMRAQQSPDGIGWEPRKPQDTGKFRNKKPLRQRAMFVKLRAAKHLKARATENMAVVEFVGRTERIAHTHHLGLRDRVQPGGPQYDYPERPLIGISDQSLDMLRDLVLSYYNK